MDVFINILLSRELRKGYSDIEKLCSMIIRSHFYIFLLFIMFIYMIKTLPN